MRRELTALALLCVCIALLQAGLLAAAETSLNREPVDALFSQHCLTCHGSSNPASDLDLSSLEDAPVHARAETWENVVKKLAGRHMPPPGLPKPSESMYEGAVAAITDALDADAELHPKPGRIDTFRRLNRTEYRNAVRDLLALDVRVEDLLPADEASHGFDNITVGDLPPTLLERYVSAAEKVSRLAMGRTGRLPDATTIRVPPDLTQENHIPGLPIGTRGGVSVPHTFPVDGEYEISVRLARDRNEDIEGLSRPHEMELLVGRERVGLFSIRPPPRGDDHRNADSHLKVRVKVAAGPRNVGAAFLKDSSALLETQRKPYQAHFNYYRHPRIQPAVYSLTVTGPFVVTGPGKTPSRERILTCQPDDPANDEQCARSILIKLAARAFRRPVGDRDIEGPMRFYRDGRDEAGGSFEAGIERALAAVLVSPRFLFRVERDPKGIAPETPYRVGPFELATRLSFFLWSSLPDDQLREAAASGALETEEGLRGEVLRMIADPRSKSLIENFAAQWLHLRNLASVRPDMRSFPDFDDNLRQAFLTETEMLLDSVVRDDRSLLDLIRADYTFVNERLAKHYAIPDVYGSRFRRVELGPESVRGGLLRHGSVLTVTSYATRTSPVIRGKWILENILGMPPPPPPADIPELKEATISGQLSVRERLAEHRANPACASCHNPMDPLGFALENFDAVGRWRTHDGGEPIDPSGELADGSKVDGVSGLEQSILRRPELFAGAVAEKLLTFALGRGVEFSDAPAIRKAVEMAKAEDYKFSALVLGVVDSTPFLMRRSK